MLGAMIGLGVGIDYSLFVINRYKTAVDAGRDPRTRRSRRSTPPVAPCCSPATTVIIALGGLFVLGINFLNGLAIASMLAVFTRHARRAVAAAGPAVVDGHEGVRAASCRGAARSSTTRRAPPMARYGNWLQKRPWVGLVALGLVVLIAAPDLLAALGLRRQRRPPDGDAAARSATTC